MDIFASGFRALSDLTRIRALRMILAADSPLCVCELADALELPQYQVSKHLAVLRQAGLVTNSRVGTWVYYSVPSETTEFAAGLCDIVGKRVDSPLFRADQERLKNRLELREEGRCVIGTNQCASEVRPSGSGPKTKKGSGE